VDGVRGDVSESAMEGVDVDMFDGDLIRACRCECVFDFVQVICACRDFADYLA
jgi:hypothetical protein